MSDFKRSFQTFVLLDQEPSLHKSFSVEPSRHHIPKLKPKSTQCLIFPHFNLDQDHPIDYDSDFDECLIELNNFPTLTSQLTNSNSSAYLTSSCTTNSDTHISSDLKSHNILSSKHKFRLNYRMPSKFKQ